MENASNFRKANTCLNCVFYRFNRYSICTKIDGEYPYTEYDTQLPVFCDKMICDYWKENHESISELK